MPRAARAFEARFPGTCRDCGEAFPVGTPIRYRDGQAWHAECPGAPPVDLAEQRAKADARRRHPRRREPAPKMCPACQGAPEVDCARCENRRMIVTGRSP